MSSVACDKVPGPSHVYHPTSIMHRLASVDIHCTHCKCFEQFSQAEKDTLITEFNVLGDKQLQAYLAKSVHQRLRGEGQGRAREGLEEHLSPIK